MRVPYNECILLLKKEHMNYDHMSNPPYLNLSYRNNMCGASNRMSDDFSVNWLLFDTTKLIHLE